MHHRTFDWTNDTGAPVELIYEPDGMSIDIPPGASLHLLCSGSEEGNLEADHGNDRIVVFGWPSSKAEIFIDRVPVYTSPLAVPALPPRVSTREFILGIFGFSTDAATKKRG